MTETRLIKLVSNVLSNPKNVQFDTLSKILEGFGYVQKQPNGGSSHYVFRKTGAFPISVPKKKPVNTAYVKKVIDQLDLEEWYEKNH